MVPAFLWLPADHSRIGSESAKVVLDRGTITNIENIGRFIFRLHQFDALY
jgi:hypothetical protein